MKTLILLILISITGTSSQKSAEVHSFNCAATETSKSTSTVEPVTSTEKDFEMPNNWNVKVIEW